MTLLRGSHSSNRSGLFTRREALQIAQGSRPTAFKKQWDTGNGNTFREHNHMALLGVRGYLGANNRCSLAKTAEGRQKQGQKRRQHHSTDDHRGSGFAHPLRLYTFLAN